MERVLLRRGHYCFMVHVVVRTSMTIMASALFCKLWPAATLPGTTNCRYSVVWFPNNMEGELTCREDHFFHKECRPGEGIDKNRELTWKGNYSVK